MLSIWLGVTLLVTVQCVPLENNENKEGNVQPAILPQEELKPPIGPVEPVKPLEIPEAQAQPQPQPEVSVPNSGAPPPGDLAEAPDANPEAQPGNSDLDTDATFWGGYGGWGYRRPYSGWGGYYGSPWKRWGGYGYGGRGYGGWGWGGRGWGWGGGYWG